MNCRNCQQAITLPLIDLGSAPPSNRYLTELSLKRPELWFPLRVLVCQHCWLAQTEDFTRSEELFDSDYAYFSAFSTTWLEHCRDFVEQQITRLELDSSSYVVEVAANDGYLLQYFLAKNIDCLGIEPTASTAAAARGRGIEIVEEFFGTKLAAELAHKGKLADLTIANNVLAHVPDIVDFVKGFALLLKSDGVATFEFPHILRMLQDNQFDTIYHEHFSYLSLTAVADIMAKSGMQVYDVEQLPTHGGSLRVFAQRQDTGKRPITDRVGQLLALENEEGLSNQERYSGFQASAEKIKNDLLSFLIEARRSGKAVAAYGAAAKGNTLLNFAGIRSDLVSFVADLNPAKQGKFLPGSRIPIVSEKRIQETRPDFVLILPWNLRQEVEEQLSYIRDWGGRFVTAIPSLQSS